MTRINNLDFLRFFGASLVVFGHGQIISGFQATSILAVSVAVVGVMIFFTISGYLITDSWERQQSLKVFLVNRCLRIFPALIVVTLLTALLLGPAITSLSLGDYFTNPSLLFYFRNIFLYTTYFLPGLFENNPFPNAVNGSLWSLAPEFFCYLIVAVIGVTMARGKIWAYLALFILIASACLYSPAYKGPQIVIYAADAFQAAAVMVYFIIGALIRLARIPMKASIVAALLIVYFLLSPSASPYLNLAFVWIVISYTCLTFGFMSTPFIRKWGRFGDFSYGIYLYSFPIQQTLIQYFGKVDSPFGFILASYIASIFMAFLSWHLIEKVALKFKPKKQQNYQVNLSAGSGQAYNNISAI